MRYGLGVLLAVLLVAAPAGAQSPFGPAHHSIAIARPATGSQNILPAFNRRLLGLINDSGAVIYCAVDGQNAAPNEGIRLNANGGSALFDHAVPQGPIRCFSATDGSRVLITEGR